MSTKGTTRVKKDSEGLLITKMQYSVYLQRACMINTSKEVEMAYYLLTMSLHLFPEHPIPATAKERTQGYKYFWFNPVQPLFMLYDDHKYYWHISNLKKGDRNYLHFQTKTLILK